MSLLCESRPLGLTLVSLWCWLNVAAMTPTLGDPVIVLFGFAAHGSGAYLLKFLIFANAIVISALVSARLHPGRIVLMGWLPVMFLSSLLTDFIPLCPLPVKIAAYEQVLFGGLLPYLYVTLVLSSNFAPMHVANALITIAIIWVLIKHRSLFRGRAPIPAIPILLMVFMACNSEQKIARDAPLLPAETFRWCNQPLTFQPPPAKWERHKHNQGGLRGVWFTHRGSVGERIYVSEYYQVGQRAEREEVRFPYSIDEVVAETRFSTEGWPIPADSFVVEEMQRAMVAGVPAYRLDFVLNAPERIYVGREYYFTKENYLFEAAYLGLPENLPIFERVVATIVLESLDGL